ncbi:hypothetical protein L596_001108 [Steinernema carpocapsae]|uniref:Uncharacterized protein n=1 Tax=Steinernema carpocapsae TaxID=34508 RepID=A0A4U8UMD8_STECR|nr:hypothetical protein L596_001108 [Steinernema carpocapsae]
MITRCWSTQALKRARSLERPRANLHICFMDFENWLALVSVAFFSSAPTSHLSKGEAEEEKEQAEKSSCRRHSPQSAKSSNQSRAQEDTDKKSFFGFPLCEYES